MLKHTLFFCLLIKYTYLFQKSAVFIKNPLIISLGIAEYDDSDLDALPGCTADIDKMEKLWISQFKYNKKNLFSNKNKPY